ncbi:MAG: hypothetical protein Q4P13_09500, partial [Psychrobacter sp.]|nr:hypothetical protein [Psychrobacter sp.]
TMRVSEAIKKWGEVIGTEIEVTGIAEISDSLSVIYDSRDNVDRSAPIIPGILVHGNQLANLVQSLPNHLAGYAGSEVLYVVKVRILGIVANTGYTFAPLKLGHIYEIEFDDACMGIQSLTVNDRLKDIVFKVDRSLKAKEVKEFENYFTDFGNRVELKRYLESGCPLVLIKRVLESELSEHEQFLKNLNFEYELQNSPIENGFFGMP